MPGGRALWLAALTSFGCEKRVEMLQLPDCQRAFLRVPIAVDALGPQVNATGLAVAEMVHPETPIGSLKAREISPAILRLSGDDTPQGCSRAHAEFVSGYVVREP